MARTTGTTSLADLRERGVLRPGEEIVIRRRWASVTAGTIQNDGMIRFGRQVFKVSTGAAKEARNAGSTSGSLRWRVTRLDRRSLAERRESS